MEENNKNTCVIPGTFDPVTNGHMDLIIRALPLFGRIYVVSFENSMKNPLFAPEERKKMLELACGDIGGGEKITVEATGTLLADYARSKGARFIVKGARNSADYEYEYMLSVINREIGDGIDTLIIPSKPEHSHISSAFVREMIAYGKDIANFMPEKARLYAQEILKDKNLKRTM